MLGGCDGWLRRRRRDLGRRSGRNGGVRSRCLQPCVWQALDVVPVLDIDIVGQLNGIIDRKVRNLAATDFALYLPA